jgi:hypothetical protein
LRSCNWEEPQIRPKGRAFEDVLISALEVKSFHSLCWRCIHTSRTHLRRYMNIQDELRNERLTFETEAKKNGDARTQMMEKLAQMEDQKLEVDAEVEQVKEDRDKHLGQILQVQERLAREILIRKEEKESCNAVLKQREQLVDSLMKQRQDLQVLPREFTLTLASGCSGGGSYR